MRTILCPGSRKKVKVSESVSFLAGLTLWDPMDWGSLPGSSVHGIFQARILEWVAIPFSLLRNTSRAALLCLQATRFHKFWVWGGWYYLILLGWLRSSFWFSHKHVQKNPNKLFGQPNTSSISTPWLDSSHLQIFTNSKRVRPQWVYYWGHYSNIPWIRGKS